MHYERAEWFPDGQRILFGGTSRIVRPEPSCKIGTVKSLPPDSGGNGCGSRVAGPKYVTVAAAGKLSLFPIAGGEPKISADLESVESVIRWSGDGRFLFLRKLEEPALLKINRLEVATGRKELWKELKIPDPVGVQMREVVLTPDGNSYAYSFQRDIATLYLVTGLR